MAKMGRPKIEINWETLDSLCGIHCTKFEISSILNCSEDTLERVIKKKHGVTFAAYYEQKAASGKSSIRRQQYKTAMAGNVTMMIWLGKQWLSQTDKIVQHIDTRDVTELDATLLNELKEAMICKEQLKK